jgi:hypothetical protein
LIQGLPSADLPDGARALSGIFCARSDQRAAPRLTVRAKALASESRYTGVSIRALVLIATIASLVTGCKLTPSDRRAQATPYQSTNVFRVEARLPESIRRVALLPIPRSRTDANQATGADSLEPLFIAEMNKHHAFEVIPVSPERLRALTGGHTWTADDQLPTDFFERLHQATGCDAVIFLSLTTYRAYPPLQVGWKARLVDGQQHLTWWAVDEVFDAGSDSVAAAAIAFANSELNPPDSTLDGAAVLRSPRRFGQYTAYAIVHTLPGR